MPVRTRFAPSPTGVLHLGSVRTALFCWLYARHSDGTFLLRIEDTDRERSTKENVDAILDGMAWLGLDYDEGPIYQSGRSDRYRAVIEEWLDAGKAYECFCTREELDVLRAEQMARGERVRYDGRCRERTGPRRDVDPVVRFRNPTEGQVVVEDRVRGRVVFENAQLDDLIIARSDRSPTYNFTVVVDDSDMNISHVIRGDDHLNNTPRQINMYSAMGTEPPAFAHLPMILGPDGAKLSKRHGAVDIREYRDQGYLPEAMLNYLVRLGWSHGDQERFTVEEMVALFDLAGVNQSASSFNPEKLRWLNQQHIIAASPERISGALEPFLRRLNVDLSAGPRPADVAAAFRERASTLSDMAADARYYYEDFGDYDPQAAKKHLRPVVLDPLREVAASLGQVERWSAEKIDHVIRSVAESHAIKLGKIGQPIRVAATGGSVSPPLDVTLELLGKERAVERLRAAVAFIEARAAGAG